jgi:hypothetical protein
MKMRLLFYALMAASLAGFGNKAEANDLYLSCDVTEASIAGATSSYQENFKFRLITNAGKAQDNWDNTYNLTSDLSSEAYRFELTSDPLLNVDLVYRFLIDLRDGTLSGSITFHNRQAFDAVWSASGICATTAPPRF